MKRTLVIIFLSGLSVSAGIYFILITKQSKLKMIHINNQPIHIEIADIDKLRTKGLSGRNKLDSNHGMLFVFDTAATYSFWMKDMHFPLDFVWIKDDTIVDLTENVPKPTNLTEDPVEFYRPKSPVNRVLEINAGEIKKMQLKIGDKIIYN